MNKGLEALKVLAMSSTTIFNTKEQIVESIKTIKKELKALEIIKGFRKDKYSKIEIDGNDIIMNIYLTLDNDEIDLLKEVLL